MKHDNQCLRCAGRPAAAMLCYLVALQIVREATGVWDRLAMSAVAAGHPELAEVADTRDVRRADAAQQELFMSCFRCARACTQHADQST